jgi:hypothetical protein
MTLARLLDTIKPGLPPWGPHVRFRRVQTLVREGSPLVKLRNSALELVRDAAKSRMLPVLHFDPVVAAAWLSAEQERNSPARSSTNTKSPAKTPGGYSKYNLVIDQPERTQYVPRSAVQ